MVEYDRNSVILSITFMKLNIKLSHHNFYHTQISCGLQPVIRFIAATLKKTH